MSTRKYAENAEPAPMSMLKNQRQSAYLSASISFYKMKKDIHPQYYPNAKVRCACGATFTVGSTKPEIQIEICSRCHPFYTGKEKLIDTAGRVEKFKARREKAVAKSKTNTKQKKETKKKK